MTGDTNVLMADKTQKKLRDIRPGDEVATYEAGCITTSKINNWQSSGVDAIYTVQTQSGIILRANKEHPFLVESNGERKWSRLKDLIPGMQLVATLNVSAPQGHKPSPGSAQLVKPETATTAKTQTHRLNQLEATECGLANSAHVANQYLQKECVLPATESNTRLQSQLQNKTGAGELKPAMGLHQSSTKGWLQTAITFAMSAVNRLRTKIHGRTGAESSVLTTATTQESFEACSATIATLLSDTERFQRLYEGPLSTYSVTLDPIISIFPSGEEEVFDIEVDRTENFIADGVVSHNTRWSKRDLTGQILKNASKDGVDDWEVIEFPAILPSGTPLWPGFWKKTELEAIKAEIPVAKWEAQYQQNPTSEEGAIIKRDQWRIWESDTAPQCDYIIQSWDTAFEKSNRADYSACTTWGIFEYPDSLGNLKTNIICLDAFKARMEFPELKQKAFEMYKEWEPDTLIVEKKAAGAPLIYELRQTGILLEEYTPGKGSDKIARVNAISDLFASGVVWCPETRWADELMEELAAFPNGDNDDLVDSTSQALLRFRRGGFIQIESDEPEEQRYFRRKAAFY
jgi:predicted phage terminase large subunit-like protein